MEMDWNLKYGVLAQDKEFVATFEGLKESMIQIQKILEKLLPLREHYYKMPIADRIEYDIFLAYTMNSLKWIHLRTLGLDPATHPVKDELKRIKAAMLRWQQFKDKAKRPTMDIKAAQRFIRSGLYDIHKGAPQQNKKIKFDVD